MKNIILAALTLTLCFQLQAQESGTTFSLSFDGELENYYRSISICNTGKKYSLKARASIDEFQEVRTLLKETLGTDEMHVENDILYWGDSDKRKAPLFVKMGEKKLEITLRPKKLKAVHFEELKDMCEEIHDLLEEKQEDDSNDSK